MTEVKVVDVTPEGFGVERLISAFVVIGEEKVAVVDPGPESSREKLVAELERMGVKPDYIVLTHIHLDHGGSAGGLASRDYPKARVVVHPRGHKHLVNPAKLWESSKAVLGPIAEVYGEPVPAPEDRVIPAPDGLRLELGGAGLKIIHTPGHASHHMSVYQEPDSILYTGDSAGVAIRLPPYPRVDIPTTPPPFKPKLYLASLDRMISLEPRRVAPTHYGIHEAGTSYLGKHKAQVELWLETLKEAAVDDVDEAEAILASVDDNVSTILGVPDLRFMKMIFLDHTVLGIIDAIKRGEEW